MNLPATNIEQKRLAALHNYQILDTQPEEQFDRVSKLAAISCNTPIALISLLDEQRHWFKSKVGIDVSENPSHLSFCKYVLSSGAYLEINDTLEDDRTIQHPLVNGAPHIRFYAAHPVVDPDGFVIGTVCVYDFKPKELNTHQRDTLKILAQEVMTKILISQKQKKALQYQDFFKLSADIFCISDLKGNFTDINPALSEILGWKKTEVVGKSYSDFVHPEDLPRTKKEFNKIIEGKNSLNLINRFLTKKGTYLWLRWKSVLDIHTHQVYSTAQDISKEKEIEQITKSLFQFQNAILNGTAYAIIATDVHGVITSFNTGAAQMLGYSPNELLYQQTPEIFHDKDELLRRTLEIEVKENVSLQNGIEALTYNTRDGHEDISEWTYQHKDGNKIPVMLSITALNDQHHNITGYLYIAKDITQRIAAEQELLKAKEQAEKNAAEKDAFLTNVSHEIRTPMNAIIGFSEILIETPLNNEQKEYLKAINIAGENLMVIINDILDFSKIESGILNLHEKPCSILHIVKNIHKLLSEKAREKHIEFNLKMDNRIPDWVNTDQARLNQILINIIGNAIKFTDKGKVDIICGLVTENQTNCIIEFRIKDTGIGIKKEKQEIIFERFAQADEQTSKIYGGNGLGLSITKRLVELFKGNISVYSQSGEGSEFIITIPFVKTEEQNLSIEEHYPEPTKLSPYKILLAEDNELKQRLGQNVFHQFEMEVDIAGNGLEAIRLFKANKYDLVFLDLQMPEMDGYDVAVYIRSELKSEIPIIAMTAHSMVGEKEKCIALGMTEYISKPYRPNEVYQKIKSIEHLIRPTGRMVSPEDADAQNNNSDLTGYNLDLIREFCNYDENDVIQFIGLFIKQAHTDLKAIQDNIEAGDEKKTSFLAHRMKSSFAAFGFKKGTSLAEEIEKHPSAKTAQPTLEKLKKSVENVIIEFRKVYPE